MLERCEGGTTADVLAIVRGDRPVAVIKHHHTAGGYSAETAALQAIDGLDGLAPRLLARDDATRCVVMTWIEGRTPAIVSPAVATAAGRIRRALDGVACIDDDLALADAWPRRAEGWIGRSRALLPEAAWAFASRVLVDAPWPTRARRWCHRDFAPHNWLVDARGRVAAIDFGHARADEPMVDLVHATAPPHDDDALVDAFIEGWCGALDGPSWQLACRVAVAHGLVSATWGSSHGVERFTTLGMAILERARDRRSRWYVET